MKEVAVYGLASARHLRGDIYEVRADGNHQSFRILFATEGRYQQVLLSLEAFLKRHKGLRCKRLSWLKSAWPIGASVVSDSGR